MMGRPSKHGRRVQDMHEALVLVSGNRVAAARLLGMTTTQLRGWISYRPELAQWRRKNGFRIPKLKFLVAPATDGSEDDHDPKKVLCDPGLAVLVLAVGRARAKDALLSALQKHGFRRSSCTPEGGLCPLLSLGTKAPHEFVSRTDW